MEIWTPTRPAPPATLFGRIGRYFRSMIVGRDPLLLARRASICGMCHEETDPSSRHWSDHFRRFVCLDCVPSIVRRAGRAAVLEWLETGEFHRGPRSHKELVSWQTQSGK